MREEQTKEGITNGLASLALYDIAFTVSDIDKAIAWYTNILGFKLINRSTFDMPGGKGTAAIMEGAGIKLELLQVPGGKRIEEMVAPVPLHLIPIGNKAIVFQVEDIKIASGQLAEKAVSFAWREYYLVEGKMLCSMIEDMDGNKINIFQRNTTL